MNIMTICVREAESSSSVVTNGYIHHKIYLGGGNSHIFWNVYPENWGR